MNKMDVIRQVHQMAQQGQGAAAIQQLGQLLQAYPGDPDLTQHMGLLMLSQPGGADAAIEYLRRSVQMAPAMAEFRSNYATALNMRGRHAEAAQEYRRTLAIKPDAYAAHLGLSSALIATLEYDMAVAEARQAGALDPSKIEPWVNMAVAMVRSGRGGEAIKTIERALHRFPDHPTLLIQLIANLHYRPDVDPDRIRQEHERVGRLITLSAPPPQPFPNTREPDRPLRVGYMSPDFRDHSVMHFLRPILANHDREQFQLFAYSAVLAPDEVTKEAQAQVPSWREVGRNTDAGIEAQVRGDQIDILVDLAGHTAGSRMPSMARRLAPVQISYLGYPNTTGLPAMDYRIVDSAADPEGAERYSTEQLVRLEGGFLCYQPPADAPEVGPAPSESAGHVTFGSFNAAQKIVEPVVRAWAALLREVPGSRLVLKTAAFESASARREYAGFFAGEGIEAERVEFLSRTPGAADHLKMYDRIDVALDTFPYNGTTTTCEALWMGVPVVVLEGKAHAGRVGVSLLTTLGLREFIATDETDYVARGAALARDGARLRSLRGELRGRMRGSALCDGPAFTRKLEAAYRDAWRRWCGVSR